MATTSRLGLPLLEASQSQKHVTVNEAFTRLDDLWQLLYFEEDLDLSLSLTTTAEFPQYSIIMGVTGRVIDEVLGTATGIDVGDSGDGASITADADRYAANAGKALNASINGPVEYFPIYGGPMSIVVSGVGGSLTGGIIRLRGYYGLLDIPAAV